MTTTQHVDETVVLARVVQHLRNGDVGVHVTAEQMADDLAGVQRALLARERQVAAAELRAQADVLQRLDEVRRIGPRTAIGQLRRRAYELQAEAAFDAH